MHTLDTLLDAIYDGGKTYISRMHALQIHSWTAGQAHQPRITAKARLRKAKTLIELHDGGAQPPRACAGAPLCPAQLNQVTPQELSPPDLSGSCSIRVILSLRINLIRTMSEFTQTPGFHQGCMLLLLAAKWALL